LPLTPRARALEQLPQRLEGQQGRAMAVGHVAHQREHRQLGPVAVLALALEDGAQLRAHAAHRGLVQLGQVVGDDAGAGLAQCAGAHAPAQLLHAPSAITASSVSALPHRRLRTLTESAGGTDRRWSACTRRW
jgi:hypothetical protein